ncbi:MAG: hypothetical protein AAGJ32_11250 [Pseudomonadota bacterium]
MKKLMTGVSALVLISACGGASEEDVANEVATRVADASSAAVESAEDALAALGNITLRSGDASKADEALAAMSLASSGDGRVAFNSKSVDGASARFEGVTIAIPEVEVDDNEDVDVDTGFSGGVINVETVEFDGLDVTDEGATFSRMAFNKIELVPNDAEAAEQADVDIGTFEIVNPSPQMASWVASLMGNGAPADFPSGEALSFEKMSLADMSLVSDNTEDGTTADVAIASIDFGAAAENRMGIAAIRGVSMDVTDGEDGGTFNVSLASLGVSGAQTGIVGAIANAADGDDDAEAAEAILGAIYENPVDPGYDRFQLRDLAITGEGVNFSLPSIDNFVQRRDDGQPIGFVTEPYTLTLSADPDGGEAGGELAGQLGMIGFETIELSGKGKSSYDPDTDRLTMEPGDNTIALKDAFEVKFGADLGGYKAYGAAFQNLDLEGMAEEGAPDPTLMQDAVSALSLYGLELEFDDNSMVDRIFNVLAAQSGEDPQAMRTQAIGFLGMAPMMASGAGVDMNIVTEATTAISAFLQSPGTLTIKLDPETPLSAETFEGLDDPSGLTKEILGFSITHTE